MKATIIRIKMQLQKLREDLSILEKEVKTLESKLDMPDNLDVDFSRDKESFLAP